MKRTDLTIFAAVGLLALVAAFWFLILAPQRKEAASLSDEVSELQSSVEAAEQLATTASAAEEGYAENYHRLVVLGKAVPEDADTSSLLVELQRTADASEVTFETIELGETSDAAAAAAQVATPPPLEAPESGEATPSEGAEAAPEAGSTPAETTPAETTPASAAITAPTEATAATLPIGATVGPAALPVMPYSLSFSGGFFEIADFLASLDELVSINGSHTGVRGRLITVDGFSLTPPEDDLSPGGGAPDPNPTLDASLSVTTYLTPTEQGVVAGATPTTPPPSTATPTAAAATTPPAE